MRHIYTSLLLVSTACSHHSATAGAVAPQPNSSPRPAHLALVRPPGLYTEGDSLALAPSVAVHGDTLRVTVVVRNIGRRSLRYEWEDCSMAVRLFRDSTMLGRPVFVGGSITNRAAVCLTYLSGRVLAPADSVEPREYAALLPAAYIAGDSLPGGEYYLAAAVRIWRGAGTPWNAYTNIPAGVLEIRRGLP